MRLKIRDQHFEYANTVEGIRHLVADIEGFLKSTDTMWDEMIINGHSIFDPDQFIEYVQDHLDAIDGMELKVATKKEIEDSSILLIDEYLDRAIPELIPLSKEFYQEQTSETWTRFSQLTEGLQWLIQAQYHLHQAGRWDQTLLESTDLKHILTDLEQAIQTGDTVLIGDLITYEMKPMYEKMKRLVSEIIDKEVIRNDLN